MRPRSASTKQPVDDSWVVGQPVVHVRNAAGEYAVAAIVGGARTDPARAWITLVTGPEGKAEPARAGFVAAP